MGWDGRYDTLPTDHEDQHVCSNCGVEYVLRFVVVPTKPYTRMSVDPASMGPHPYNCNIEKGNDGDTDK